MTPDPLVEARVLAASHTLAVQSEYLRAILRVLLAMHDAQRAEPAAPVAAKRGR